MFERFDDKARRTIFFARYEASSFGSPVIEPEHLLLGILRVGKALFNPPRFPIGSGDVLRKRIEEHAGKTLPVSTSVDLPLSESSKAALKNAAQESKALGAQHIGTEHLLLGIACGEVLRCEAFGGVRT